MTPPPAEIGSVHDAVNCPGVFIIVFRVPSPPPINTPNEQIRKKIVTNISEDKRSERTAEHFKLDMHKRGLIHDDEYSLM
jgi:hypothetical protein